MFIDLNCDLGEEMGNDEALMPYITSANIACGLHAGNIDVIRSTLRLTKKYNVAAGAHPSWDDRKGFGRREMAISSDDAEELVFKQVHQMYELAKEEGVELVHVKPHGALYNQAAVDENLAHAVVRAVKRVSQELILVGLAGSVLLDAGREGGLRVVAEGFPDRGYNLNGTLMSRSQAGAVLKNPEDVAKNALRLAQDGIVFFGRPVRIDTLCLHGDNPDAVQHVITLRMTLLRNDVTVQQLKK